MKVRVRSWTAGNLCQSKLAGLNEELMGPGMIRFVAKRMSSG